MSDEELERAIEARRARLAKQDEPYGYEDAVKLGGILPDLERFDAEFDRFMVGLRTRSALTGLVLGAATLLWCAYQSPTHSFWNLLLIELSSGIAFFAVAPTVIRLARTHPLAVRMLGTVVALIAIFVAHEADRLQSLSNHAQEFMRAVLLEYAVALILMMGLELAMRPWLDGLGEKYRRLTEELASMRSAGGATQEQAPL